MVIIGITGRMGVGKDTVGDYLVRKYGFIKMTFAETLKSICALIFGFTLEQLHGHLKEVIDPRYGITPRRAMQFIGTDLFRQRMKELVPEIGERIWVEILLRKVREAQERNHQVNIVITDCRFADEAEAIQKTLGGKVWRILRPNPTVISSHSSELGDFEVDALIQNTSSFEELYEKVTDVVDHTIPNIALE